MKKILALIAALMFVIPVAACTTESTPAPTVTVTAPAPQERTDERYEASTDEQYLRAVRGQSAVLYSVPDGTLVELAVTICEGLRSGLPIETILQIGIDSGLDPTSVASIAAGAVVFYCPGADEQGGGV